MGDQFDKALAHTLQFEGGYANVSGDTGGETFRGVSRNNWPDWPGWKLIDEVKAKGNRSARLINAAFADNGEMKRLVAEFYFRNFWEPLAELPITERVLAKVFDTAVNTGQNRAVKILQQAVNSISKTGLAVDGVIGPKTKAALDGLGERVLLRAYSGQQAAFYRSLANRKPSQKKFLNGWLRRADWIPE